MRSIAPNAAILVAAAMNAVIGVGAPWYTSGIQEWNGTAPTLNSTPTSSSPVPIRASDVLPEPAATASAMPPRSSVPAYPYSMATPYRKKADEKAPSRKYFTDASCESRRRRRASPHSRDSGGDSTPRATETVHRHTDA